MHINAIEWDLVHGAPDSSFFRGTEESHKEFEEWKKTADLTDRPCDWCGKVLGVNDGRTIHKECVDKERDFYLDLMY
jgi:hypothetical protein